MTKGRKSGSVLTLDYSFTPKLQLDFQNAMIVETTIPACGSDSKEPSYIALKILPEHIASATPAVSPTTDLSTRKKIWLPSDFRLSIDGLDCSRISRIDSFTVTQGIVADDFGDVKSPASASGKLGFPNLRITLAEATSGTWQAWHKDFVIDGNNDEAKERNGSLVFLSRDLREELGRISFYNLGIVRCVPERAEMNMDTARQVIAELYCERMEFVCPGETVADTAPATATDPPTGLRVDGTRIPDSGLATRPVRTLPGAVDASLSAVHIFGGEKGLEFGLAGLDFTITRETSGEQAYIPSAKSKLMLVRYTMRNLGDTEKRVDRNTLKFVVTDSTGVNHDFSGVSVGSEKQRLETSLLPDQSLECCATIIIPARVDAATLIVTSPLDRAGKRYDVAGKIGLIEPYAIDLTVGEGRKFAALSEVQVEKGEYYPMKQLDYRVDAAAYGDLPKLGTEPIKGTRCLLIGFTVRNALPTEVRYEANTFRPVLMMSDGSTVTWNRRLLSSRADEAISGPLAPGAEIGMRLFFEVPISEEVKPVSLQMAEGDSRIYALLLD